VRPAGGDDPQPGLLIVLSGPGGVGKDTVISRLLKADPSIRYSISYTTRPRRAYEVDGEHYSFVDEAEFQRLVDSGELLEHANVNGYLYGTSRERVEAVQATGLDILLKIDVQGAERVREQRPDGVFIFLSPPSMEELMRRRHERGSESQEVMEERQRLAAGEMSFAERYDHVVINEDVERATAEILGIIQRERERRRVGSASR
jgi:guanylate kinase